MGDGATYLIQRSSVNDVAKVESMVKELQTSVDTLKLELNPASDDVSMVEAELESVISEQDFIERGRVIIPCAGLYTWMCVQC